jgi:hypothetical protein
VTQLVGSQTGQPNLSAPGVEPDYMCANAFSYARRNLATPNPSVSSSKPSTPGAPVTMRLVKRVIAGVGEDASPRQAYQLATIWERAASRSGDGRGA